MGGRVSRFYNTSMFTDDYELLNVEEFIINLLNNLRMEIFFSHSERRFIADNDEVVVWSLIRDIKGVPMKDRHVNLKKDAKFWRHTFHRKQLR